MDFENFKEKFMEDIKERLALFVGSKKLLKRKEFERFISERMEILWSDAVRRKGETTIEKKRTQWYNIKIVDGHFLNNERRAIERDLNPKALQRFLGHATLQTTTDTYVHVTDDAKVDAVNLFESNEPAIFKMA